MLRPRVSCGKRNVCDNHCVARINFDLQQLQAFVAVADCGSFRAAARQIHLSAPALSRRIERLEELLGARLFQRSTREVRLTRVGQAFLERARAALDDLEAAVLGIHEASARHAGRVTVACLPTAAVTLLPRAIAQFREAMPAVRVRLIDEGMNEVAQAVMSGEADFGLGFAGALESGLRFEPLWADPYRVAMRRDHPLARRRGLRLADLQDEPLVSVSHASRNRVLVDEQLAGGGARPLPWLEANHILTLLALVEAGLGLAIVPASALAPRHPVLKTVPLAGLALQRQIGLLSLQGRRLTPVAQRFYDQLRALLALGHAA